MTKPELEESYTRMQDAVLYGNRNNVTNIAMKIITSNKHSVEQISA